MGKSSKKSSSKVDVAPVAVTQSGKKGKRGAENEIEKAVSAKKQKVERDETVVAKQKIEKKLPKKAASSSSDDSSDDSDSDSDSEPKVVAKKTPLAAAKNGSVAKKPKEESSSDSSDSSGSDSDDSDEKPAAIVKNGAKKDSSSESDSDSSDEEEKKVAAPAPAAKKKAESSDSDSDSDSSDEEEEKKVAAPAAKKKAESSDSDSDEDSSDSDEEPKATQAKATPVAKPVAKQTKADSSSSEESSDDDSSDDEPAKAQPAKKVQAASKSESSSEDDSSSDEDESDEEETKKPALKTPKKKDTDVEMVDAEKSAGSAFQPKTPATTEATGSKTLFVGNLSFSVEESDVREFFKVAGEVVDVRFASNAEGQFRGFGHVEFATAEAAQKALELNDKPLLDRPVRLDVARERDNNRSAFTPQNRDNSFQKGGRPQGQTAFVRGFNTEQGEDEIRSALQEHFGSCGEITRISIPKDYETGGVKGMAYMDFADSNGISKALEKDNSDLGGGYYLNVQEAKPRGDSAGGSGGRFDRGGSGGRRGGGRFSGRGGRDGGGRFSGRGGRDGGRGGRGRGPITPQGKKTTFGDD
ncbi:hypothetical protein RND81_09G194800 [Saponaria officinalis]|uniref:RRM domain-containing protein n=1 Tax=Saponaria officinalis TaxID=3572 RepID=A0AAW1IQG0_SAPOF